MEVQSERLADDSTPKNDSSATKMSYGEISQDKMETTDKNKSNKGNRARTTSDVPVHNPIPFPMITENKDANTVDKQDKKSK